MYFFQTLTDLTKLYVKHRSLETGDSSCAMKCAMVDLAKYFFNRSQMDDLSAAVVDNAQPSVRKCDVNVPENCYEPDDSHHYGKGSKYFESVEVSNKRSRMHDSDAGYADVSEVLCFSFLFCVHLRMLLFCSI